tara:strand:+ start:748 stop:1194 length:447 start_codon:yes stop_codon:yes gene_type:complete
MAKGQTPALTPVQAERYRQVVQLRTAGVTFEVIAERVGYGGRGAAKDAYDSALRRWGRETIDEHRDLEGARVEELWRRTFARLAALPVDADTEDFTRLVTSAVRVAKRKADLFGIDAPRQVELAGAGGGPIVTDVGEILRARLKQLGA